MKLVEINWNPTDRQLRQFGAICLVALPLLGWLWSHGNITATWILALTGLSLALIGLPFPRAIKPVFLGLSILAIPIGMFVGELAMFLIYFGVFLPIGLLFRLMRRDRLQLSSRKDMASYWQDKSSPRGVASYYRQF